MTVCSRGGSGSIVVDLRGLQDSSTVDKISEMCGTKMGRFDTQDEGNRVHAIRAISEMDEPFFWRYTHELDLPEPLGPMIEVK